MEIWHPVWNAITFSTFPTCTHHCSDVPGHFATRRSIICRVHILCMLSGTRRRSYGTVLHGTTQNRHISSRHCKADKRKGGGKSKCQGMELFQVHHRVHKNHRGASSVIFFCFVFVFSRAIVNYSPFPPLSSRPHVCRHKHLGERKLAVLWVWCFEIPYQEMWTWSEPKEAPKLSQLCFLRRKTITTHSSTGKVCILTPTEGEKRIDF